MTLRIFIAIVIISGILTIRDMNNKSCIEKGGTALGMFKETCAVPKNLVL